MYATPPSVAAVCGGILACVRLALGFGLEQPAVPAPVRQIAIIGAGAAGSSTAYFLRKYADEYGAAVNITIFEKTDRIGGRTLTIDPFGNASQRVELGASIFIDKNYILNEASAEFNLPLIEPYGDSDNTMGIWDGDKFVFTIDLGHSTWWNALKVVWKYGYSAPRQTEKVLNTIIGRFLKLYSNEFFPFRSLTQRVYELGLHEATGLTGEQFLATNYITNPYAHDIIQASTRVNYASNLANIHGLDTMVSMAPHGSVSVGGGNWQIFDRMVKSSGASLVLNTSVTTIQRDQSSKYALKATSAGSNVESSNPMAFDDVVLATPYQFSEIAADSVIEHAIDEIPYVQLHVTIFATPFLLSLNYFNLTAKESVPSMVVTTLGADDGPDSGVNGAGKAGFFSINILRKVVNPATQSPEYLYKVFSPEKLTPDFLSRLFGVPIPDTIVNEANAAGGRVSEPAAAAAVTPISWYFPHVFNAYPKALPRITFQDPILGPGLFYTSGMESFISTMETNALMGKNVARLIVGDIVGGKDETQAKEEDGRGDL